MAGGPSLYDRQRGLDLTVPRSAIVVGCGGVGSWVATFLAMSGVGRLYLWDPDALEPSNFNRLPLPPTKSGANKARALREWLITLRPEALIIANGVRADEVVLAPAEVIFDCTDDFSVRVPLYRWAEANSVRYVRAGYDGGQHISVASSLPWTVGEPLGRYEVVPSWVVPAALAALLAVYTVIGPRVAGSSDGPISTDLFTLIQAARALNGE